MDENFKNLHLQLSIDDIRKIDLWKAKYGMKSRSEAIRSILRTVIDEKGNSSSSSDYMLEKNSSDFLSPSNSDDEIKNMVRDLVKEEIKKLND